MAPSVLRSFLLFAVMIIAAVGAVAILGSTMEAAHQEQVPDT